MITSFISFLTDMHKSVSGYESILEKTVAVLDEEALQMLLTTTQLSNIMFCIMYAVRR